MNEVEKMYRNVHVYPRIYGDITKETFENRVFNMGDMCNEAFTAEKQLELIKWLAKYDISIWHTKVWDIEADELSGCISGEVFENVLAQYINYLWQDLTEEERKQIKEILNG